MAATRVFRSWRIVYPFVGRQRCRYHASNSVPLTADYYNIKRKDYAVVNELDMQEFRKIVGHRMITDPSETEPYNIDWLRIVRGQSKVVLRPKTTQEVSQILNHCNNRRIAVVPQGGNTGLVGGSVPVFDEVVLSLSLMNQVISVDEQSGILVCQAGCVLEDLDTKLANKGLMVPLDLGAKGSCQIGGNASTNAGGLRLLRYGSLRGNILGLEVVLPDGTVLDSLSTLRKDNTGYDLKQLFIGGEGTLGVITAVSILAPPRPKFTQVALMCGSNYNNVCKTFTAAKSFLGETLSAVEFFDEQCRELTDRHLHPRNPLPHYPFYILVETSGSSEGHTREMLNSFIEHVLSEGFVADGTMAENMTKVQALWQLREKITEALLKEGVVYKYDISLPLDRMYDLVKDVRERCKDMARTTVGYGHLGDGNLHLNIVGESHSPELLALIEPYVYEWTARYKGSISAEHGLGFKKANYIHFSKSREAILLMHSIKNLIDPKGILNPYKTLPSP